MQVTLTEQLETLRPILMRFASLQLRNDRLAEDVVQNTLLAVVEHPDGFTGQSSLRAYVIGIMKHKIVAALQTRQHTMQFEPCIDDGGEVIDRLFDADGHVRDRPRHWGRPDKALEQPDFFSVLETCLQNLPTDTARLFMMREWLQLDTADICREMHISEADAWAMLYRARLHLRECLDIHWFDQQILQKGK